MLLEVVCGSEVLRCVSDAAADGPICNGSVELDLSGGGALDTGDCWAGDSELAEVGVGIPFSDFAEGLRDSMVGMGVGLGAGRV